MSREYCRFKLVGTWFHKQFILPSIHRLKTFRRKNVCLPLESIVNGLCLHDIDRAEPDKLIFLLLLPSAIEDLKLT